MKKVSMIILLTMLLFGCDKDPATTNDNVQLTFAEEPMKGVSLSPISFVGEDFTGFFAKAKAAGDIVMWAGDWYELETGAGNVVAGLSEVYGYIPLIEVTYYSQGINEFIRRLEEISRARYIQIVSDYAERSRPRYLGIGIESDVMYEKSPEEFEEFVKVYDEAYEAVKSKSPDTKVFTVFQLENMKGLKLWETGGKGQPQWELIDRFKTDIVVFSTYPGLIYKDPGDIPADHYKEILIHTNKSIAFTEIGWHSGGYPIGWESSEDEQARFIETFFELTKDLDVELYIWSFLYDQETIEPFDSMGLYDREGHERPALDAWINAQI